MQKSDIRHSVPDDLAVESENQFFTKKNTFANVLGKKIHNNIKKHRKLILASATFLKQSPKLALSISLPKYYSYELRFGIKNYEAYYHVRGVLGKQLPFFYYFIIVVAQHMLVSVAWRINNILS